MWNAKGTWGTYLAYMGNMGSQRCRRGCDIGVAFGGCGSINAWLVCVYVGPEAYPLRHA